MTAACSTYRNLIPRAAVGEIGAEELKSLSLHLAECVPCSNEHSQYVETLRVMRESGDVAVPRHFFVYAQEPSGNPWLMFRRMNLAWQAGFAAAILLLGVFAAAAASQLEVRAGNGALTISFGNSVPTPIAPVPQPVIDAAGLKADILNAVEEKNRREKLEWVKTLRTELDKSSRSMSERQRRILQTALVELETRLDSRMSTEVRNLEDRSDRALTGLYQLISTERQRDLASLNNRFNRLVTSSEVRSDQTDQILETLLQVAELKLK